MKSKKVWIWVGVSVLVFCGIVAAFLLFRTQAAIPKFLVDTKKPIQIWRRNSRIFDGSNLEGMTLKTPFLRETKTKFFIEGIQPEEVIEGLTAYTGIREERVTPTDYRFEIGNKSYYVGYSQYEGHKGSLVSECEDETSVPMLDVYMTRWWSDWPDTAYGKVDNVPDVRLDSAGVPPLDLIRIKKARPKTVVKEK